MHQPVDSSGGEGEGEKGEEAEDPRLEPSAGEGGAQPLRQRRHLVEGHGGIDFRDLPAEVCFHVTLHFLK